MKEKKKARIEKKGWKVGSTQDFLGLSDEEMQLVEVRIALGNFLREKRESSGYTQTIFAKEIGSSQSRVARMEAGDSSVTIDLILKSLFHITSKKEVCSFMASL